MPTQTSSPSSIFARPLNASKFPVMTPHVGPNTPVWSRQVMWTLAAVMCGLLIGLARPNNAQNVPNSTSSRGAANNATRQNTSGSRQTLIAQARPATPSVEPASDAPEESRRPVGFYTGAVRSGLFSAPQPPAPAPIKTVAPILPKPLEPAHVVPPPVDPFASWAYTGTITQGDQTIALLENTQTKEGQFLKAGDSLMGAQVKSITDQMVTLELGGKPRMLAKSDNINVTPLDRSAAPTAPAAPQPGQPQQPVINFQMPTVNTTTQPMVTLPNGFQMSPQRAQRRNRFMNNNFNQ
jgi:hypothetical protein